jgi:hypothetical protein
LAALAVTLVCTAVALAVVGLQNPSFESGLDHWHTLQYDSAGNRSTVYQPDEVPCNEASLPLKREGICVVGTDTFPVEEAGQPPREVSVSPVDGSKMLRIDGPFNNPGQKQSRDRLAVYQEFVVDASNPVLEVNFNIFTFDYSGFDEAEFKVALSGEDGEVLDRRTVGGFGPGGDISLKTTGWRPVFFDLGAQAGEQVRLEISSTGTKDSLFGFWTYVDAGVLPAPAVEGAEMKASVPPPPGGGNPVISKQVSAETGQATFQIAFSELSKYPEGCMPMSLSLPIDPAGGTVSNVKLLLGGAALPMTQLEGNLWGAQIPCVEEGTLNVSYDLTENGITQSFIVPLGGIDLIDPEGVVYDAAQFTSLKAEGKSNAEALQGAALAGATVELQRRTGEAFAKVLAGDPGISPNVNPETTAANGVFHWDVSGGQYRVRVTRTGYSPALSRVVTIPPPVFDLNVGLEPIESSPPEEPKKGTAASASAATGSAGRPAVARLRARIVAGPARKTRSRSATFKFKAQAGATFECKLDRGKLKRCRSPKTYDRLAPGKHTFTLRATGQDGSPAKAAKWVWQVLGSGGRGRTT